MKPQNLHPFESYEKILMCDQIPLVALFKLVCTKDASCQRQKYSSHEEEQEQSIAPYQMLCVRRTEQSGNEVGEEDRKYRKCDDLEDQSCHGNFLAVCIIARRRSRHTASDSLENQRNDVTRKKNPHKVFDVKTREGRCVEFDARHWSAGMLTNKYYLPLAKHHVDGSAIEHGSLRDADYERFSA
jgi:hypothetical protein